MPELRDNSAISAHRRCNRYYYFSYERWLVPDGVAISLIFGDCWHSAMDVVWKAIKDMPNLSNDEVAQVAYENFKQRWLERGMPEPDSMSADQIGELGPRTPDNAFFTLCNYIEKRRPFIEQVELLEVEKPFAVPLFTDDADVFYVGKRDKDIRWNGRVWCVEHKHTSWGSKNGISQTYLETFSPNSQIDGYIHSLNMEYGKEAKGALVDISLIHKTVNDCFQFLPVEKSVNSLEGWLWRTRRELQLMKANQEALKEVSPDYTYMAAFPENDTACIQFMRPCPYIDICKTLPNPESLRDRVPSGFKKMEASPIDRLGLEKIGLKR